MLHLANSVFHLNLKLSLLFLLSRLDVPWINSLVHQWIVLPSRGNLTGWRNSLTKTSASSSQWSTNSAPDKEQPQIPGHTESCPAGRQKRSWESRWTPSWTLTAMDPCHKEGQSWAALRKVPRRSREGIFPFFSALLRPCLECYVQFCPLPSRCKTWSYWKEMLKGLELL